MDALSLNAQVREQLDAAGTAHSGRAAHTVYGGQGHFLRQTLIALKGGHALGEHNSSGEATLQVLAGRVRLVAGDDSCDGRAGDLLAIPPVRHSLSAIEDSAVLLTVLADQ